MKEKIIIYTNENCNYCSQVKDILTENNYKFEEVVANADSVEWNKVIVTTGVPNTPILLFKGTYFVPGRDFNDENHLVNILNGFDQVKVTTTNELILERIKTLAYFFNNAFARLYTDIQAIKKNLDIESQGFNTEENGDKSAS